MMILAIAALTLASGVAVPEPDDRPVIRFTVYGNDRCPQSSSERIVVCARLPEDDRFRIPPQLRDNPNDPNNQSWANRAIELSYAGRGGTDSCSTVGASGFTGCFNQIVRQARAERGGGGEVNWESLIEQARRDRMRRIGEAEAEEVEAEVDRNVPPRN